MLVKDFPGKFARNTSCSAFGSQECILFGGLTAKCVVEVSVIVCAVCVVYIEAVCLCCSQVFSISTPKNPDPSLV